MRICITGPSRSGKTVLGSVLGHIIQPRPEVISGDRYLTEFDACRDASIAKLHADLVGSRHFIFEHVSAFRLLKKFAIEPDIVVFLTPDKATLLSRGLDERYFADSRLTHQKEQLNEACSVRHDVIIASDVAAALRKCLDVLAERGQFPPPIHTVVLKVASQCNLGCTYCYMYKGEDDSWKSAPPTMSANVAKAVGRQLAEYHHKTNRSVSVVFHGGEPLMLPTKEFRKIAEAIKSEVGNIPDIQMGVQTNGTLITEEYLQCIDDLGMGIGISLDGAWEANRDRPNLGGRDTGKLTEAGIKLSSRYPFTRGRFGGVLCVVNPNVDGADVYRYFRSLGVTSIDFLLRDLGHKKTAEASSLPFLKGAFAEWLLDAQPATVRFFKAIVAQLLDQNWTTDVLGLAPMGLLGVGTGGNWELLDILRTTFPGAWQTPYNIFEHTIEYVQSSAEFRRTLAWQYDLSDKCVGCKNLLVCGAGYLPSRFNGIDFKNPSRHCEDLYAFIDIVSHNLHQQLTYP